VQHRTRVAGVALAGVMVTAALVTACGGAPSGSPNAAPSGNYVACLRDHGVPLPQGGASGRPRGSFGPDSRPSGLRPSGVRPSGGARSGGTGGGPGGGGFGGGFGFGSQAPPGVDQATWDKALQACAALRPSVNPSRFRDNGAIMAYRNCLGEHGVTASAAPLDQLDTNDPTVAAALKACEPLRPGNRPASTPTPAPTPTS
jgi:hypothetical protein